MDLRPFIQLVERGEFALSDPLESLGQIAPIPFEKRYAESETMKKMNCPRKREKSKGKAMIGLEHGLLDFHHVSPPGKKRKMTSKPYRWPLSN